MIVAGLLLPEPRARTDARGELGLLARDEVAGVMQAPMECRKAQHDATNIDIRAAKSNAAFRLLRHAGLC